MIVVDTSALVAILLNEPEAEVCSQALEVETDVRISAGTLAEALIVAMKRQRAEDMRLLVEGLGLTVEPLSSAGANRVSQAYGRWGKGVNRAGLNFGDCFAYALAKELDCPLLFVGEDFSRTDARPALA